MSEPNATRRQCPAWDFQDRGSTIEPQCLGQIDVGKKCTHQSLLQNQVVLFHLPGWFGNWGKLQLQAKDAK